jgi:hypothetical protein
VTGAAGQTVSLQEWRDSLGASLASISASGTFTGNGSGLTSLNASQLTSGTVSASRIPDIDASKLTGAIQVDSLGRVGINNTPFSNVTLNVRKVGDSGDPVVVNVELNSGADLFQVQQNGKVWAQDSFITGSDIRLKNSITSLGEVMPRIRQLNPSVYRLNAQGVDAPLHIGFIAQEVQPLFPETVSTNGEYLAVSYGEFAPIAIKAIQEQQAQLDAKEARIKSLEDRLSRLETLIEQLTPPQN